MVDLSRLLAPHRSMANSGKPALVFGVPVLILTSSQSGNDRAVSIELGAEAYIGKPPTLSEFLSTVGSGVRALLERSNPEPRARLRPSIWKRRRTHGQFRTFQPDIKRLLRRFHGGRLRVNSAI
jgi:DNA-binding response OmpR family regulator